MTGDSLVRPTPPPLPPWPNCKRDTCVWVWGRGRQVSAQRRHASLGLGALAGLHLLWLQVRCVPVAVRRLALRFRRPLLDLTCKGGEGGQRALTHTPPGPVRPSL